jgi:hypothetical protein
MLLNVIDARVLTSSKNLIDPFIDFFSIIFKNLVVFKNTFKINQTDMIL